MTTITFDTHKFIKTLQEAGFEPKQAEAVSAAFKDATSDAELATKADLKEIKTELKADIQILRSEIMGELKLNRWMLAAIVVAEVAPLLAKLFHA